MANPAPVGRRLHIERVNDLTEAGLELVAEQREISSKRMRKLRIIAHLEEADQIERERAVHRVERAQGNLRQAQAELRAAVEDQERQAEICIARAEIWKEILGLEEEDERTVAHSEREFARKGHAAGAAYIHPDLLEPNDMVAGRKQPQVRGMSAAEAEAL